MKQHKKQIILVILLAAVILFIRLSGIGQYLTFEMFLMHKEFLHRYVDAHYITSVIWFISAYTAVAALSIPGAVVLSLAGGFLFGTLYGIIYSNIGATVGSLCIFFITRYLLGSWLQMRYGRQLQKFNEEIGRHGSNYFLTLRFIPLFPFFLVNIFAGLTKVPFKTFAWTTSIGILPGDAVYSFAGNQLDKISSLKDVLSVNILAALFLLGIFSLIPVAYNRLRHGKQLML